MDELVQATGVSRHGLYSDFGGKQDLLVACLNAYSHLVVTLAFAQVEAEGAAFDAIANYYEHQIARGAASGLPGPGCLMANTMTEVAPHDAAVSRIVTGHNVRLHVGFRNALGNAAHARAAQTTARRLSDLATMLVAFTNGLWSLSRTISNPTPLRRAVREMLAMTEGRLGN